MRTKLQHPKVCGPLGMTNLEGFLFPCVDLRGMVTGISWITGTQLCPQALRIDFFGRHASTSPIPADLGISLRLFIEILKLHLFFLTLSILWRGNCTTESFWFGPLFRSKRLKRFGIKFTFNKTYRGIERIWYFSCGQCIKRDTDTAYTTVIVLWVFFIQSSADVIFIECFDPEWRGWSSSVLSYLQLCSMNNRPAV